MVAKPHARARFIPRVVERDPSTSLRTADVKATLPQEFYEKNNAMGLYCIVHGIAVWMGLVYVAYLAYRSASLPLSLHGADAKRRVIFQKCVDARDAPRPRYRRRGYSLGFWSGPTFVVSTISIRMCRRTSWRLCFGFTRSIAWCRPMR